MERRSRKKRREELEDLSTDELAALVATLEAEEAKLCKRSKHQDMDVARVRVCAEVPAALSPRVLVVGSACTGWVSECRALQRLQVPHIAAFACDKDPSVKHFTTQHFPFSSWYDDIFSEQFESAPTCDIFTCGFPCQPFSNQGASSIINKISLVCSFIERSM